jgi:hypothetical protein
MKRIPWASILAIAAVAVCASGAGASGPPTAGKPPAQVSGTETNPALLWQNEITGKVLSVKGTTAQLETRKQRTVELDVSVAIEMHRVNAFKAGAFITAVGIYDAKGVFHAQAIFRAKSMPSWPLDR